MCILRRPAKERSKVPAKMPDRSISPLPNPPTGHSLKLPNKLTNTSRSQSPSVGGRPPKKKKKTATVSGVTVKEDTIPVAVPVTQEPVALLPDTSSSSKSKSDASKPSTHPTAPVSSLSSSLSSSDSELEEVTGISMPTITPGNMVATAAAHGNNVGMAKRGRGYDGSSSSSGSDSGGSSSGSASDSDEVILHHILVESFLWRLCDNKISICVVGVYCIALCLCLCVCVYCIVFVSVYRCVLHCVCVCVYVCIALCLCLCVGVYCIVFVSVCTVGVYCIVFVSVCTVCVYCIVFVSVYHCVCVCV